MVKYSNQFFMVYFFIPNIIGYVRVITGVLAFWYYKDSNLFFIFYFISYFLDCIDGCAARYFDQATRFGQMLDMVTDRCCSAGLLAVLAHLYEGPWAFSFLMLLALDLASHYCHVYSQLLSGVVSHKKLADDENWFLKLYYGSQKVLFILCLTNESFFVFLYMLRHAQITDTLASVAKNEFLLFAYILAPFAFLKQYTNVLQFMSACRKIVAYDIKQRANK